MIDGLKLVISGDELRRLLNNGIARHEESASWYTKESKRTTDDQTEDDPVLPEHMCEYEAERHTWRAEVLGFIRDHVEATETYHLSASDLEFGELLPPKPGGVEQEEFEERTRTGFSLERLVKSLDTCGIRVSGALECRTGQQEGAVTGTTVLEDTDEYRATRINVEGGPEIVHFERK